MLRINQIKLPVLSKNVDELILNKVIKLLKVKNDRIKSIEIVRRSIDARETENLYYVYSVNVAISDEKSLKIKDKNISHIDEKIYRFPFNNINSDERPVVIGMGPAGLFCALYLARAGFKPVVYERGDRIEDRINKVSSFWDINELDINSNVQFGEGGAGAFSDGKLNTLVKDKNGRNKEVLRTLVEHGADESILYDSKPHIGTDKLVPLVKSIRNEIIGLGGEVHYNSILTELCIVNNELTKIYINNKSINTKNVVLAIGHSARDTFEMLNASKVNMEPKAFAVGFRVMHPQKLIDIAQYGNEHEKYNLGAASYKLTAKTRSGRGVYSFCMCPGGYVVNASSEKNRLAVNGMSYHDRDSGTANSAIVVTVTPEDYGDSDALSGMYFQRNLEENAYNLANGSIPVQKYGDFSNKYISRSDTSEIEVDIKIKGNYEFADLTELLPDECNRSIVEGMEHFGRIINGFNDGNAIFAGIESRTSSPVRILRDINGESSFKGIFPCGEGAGYAGGITSAAMDGIFIAECVAKKIIEG